MGKEIGPEPLLLTRRRFAGALGAVVAVGTTGCGGGGSAEALSPVPTPAPAPTLTPAPAPVTGPRLELLAGGTGAAGMVEGRGTQARLTHPSRVAARADGFIYFCARDNVIGRVSPQGDVRYLAELPNATIGGMALDSHGVLHLSSSSGQILKLLEDGTTRFAVLAGQTVGFQDGPGGEAQLNGPGAMVFDSSDNLYFVDGSNKAIRRVSPAGAVTTIAGGPTKVHRDGPVADAGFANPSGLVWMPDGSLVVLDAGLFLRRVTPGGTVSTSTPASGLAIFITAITLADAESLYAVGPNVILRMSLGGAFTLIAGFQGQGSHVDAIGAEARFLSPTGLARYGDALFVADDGNHVLRRLELATREVTTWAGAAPQSARIDGTGSAARFVLAPYQSTPMARGDGGNVYMLDRAVKRVRKVTPAGVVTTLFSDFPSDGGLAVDGAGNFYGVRDRTIVRVTPAGVQSVIAGRPGVLGFADGPADRAEFARPMALTFDPQGNLFVADAPEQIFEGTTLVGLRFGNTLRKITPQGVVSTFSGESGREVAATLGNPVTDYVRVGSLSADASGNLVVFDAQWPNVRRIAGIGGPPVVLESGSETTETRAAPTAAAVTPSGTVYFVEFRSHKQLQAFSVTVRRLLPGGGSVTVAGRESLALLSLELGALPASLLPVEALMCLDDRELVLTSADALLRAVLA